VITSTLVLAIKFPVETGHIEPGASIRCSIEQNRRTTAVLQGNLAQG
jgi:hypothetical protein